MALDLLDPPADPLPADLRARHALVGLDTALRDIHRPADRGALERARKRLKWEEALPLQALLAQRRLAAAARPGKARPPVPDGILAAFDERLPFSLTDGQRAVGATLAGELASEHPMHRLLQGEVGSGKTVCALRAMLQVVDAGGQAALLAPTEVLAAQHARSLRGAARPAGHAPGSWTPPSTATRVALLTGSLPAAGPPPGADRGRLRCGRDRRRHPRAAQRGRRVRRPRPGRGRRAAPLRRRAAGRAAGQGRQPRTCW